MCGDLFGLMTSFDARMRAPVFLPVARIVTTNPHLHSHIHLRTPGYRVSQMRLCNTQNLFSDRGRLDCVRGLGFGHCLIRPSKRGESGTTISSKRSIAKMTPTLIFRSKRLQVLHEQRCLVRDCPTGQIHNPRRMMHAGIYQALDAVGMA